MHAHHHVRHPFLDGLLLAWLWLMGVGRLALWMSSALVLGAVAMWVGGYVVGGVAAWAMLVVVLVVWARDC